MCVGTSVVSVFLRFPLLHCLVFLRLPREAAAAGSSASQRSAVGPNRSTGRAGGGGAEVCRPADQREQRRAFWGAAQGKLEART